jgi:hypothetical protein
MRRLAAAFVFFALLGCGVSAAEHREVDLIVRALQAGETLLLEVQLGMLPRGKEIELTTPSGRELGVVSPHGIRPGHEAGTYTVPVPADLVTNGHLIVRLSITEPNGGKRAPTPDEVKNVRVKIVGGNR